jgi:hypothetical protein
MVKWTDFFESYCSVGRLDSLSKDNIGKGAMIWEFGLYNLQ